MAQIDFHSHILPGIDDGSRFPEESLAMLLMLVLTGFAFVGEPFIEAWGGGEYEGAFPIAMLLMIPVTATPKPPL